MSQSVDYGVADILASELKDNQVRVNLGDAVTGKGFGQSTPMYCAEGFYSMPNDPGTDGTEKGAAQAFFVRNGEIKIIIGARDNRWIGAYGELSPGDRIVASNCSAIFGLKKDTSSFVFFAKNEASGNKDMAVDLNGSTGTFTHIVGGEGSTSIVQQTHDTILLGVDGGGSIRIDKDGVHVFGPYFGCNCGKGNFGVYPGNLPPPPGINSIVIGVSGMAGAASPNWTML